MNGTLALQEAMLRVGFDALSIDDVENVADQLRSLGYDLTPNDRNV